MNQISYLNDFVKYDKSVLSNGLKIISEEIKGNSFALGIAVMSGSACDPEGFEGLAHFVEHAVFRGTKNRKGKAISDQFEKHGIYSNAFTTKEITCFYVRALTEKFPIAMELLSDIVLNPLFVENDIIKEKKIIIEEVKSYEDDPEEYIFDHSDNIIYGNNGYGHPITGNTDSVSYIVKNTLQDFHSLYYVPNNIIISCAGSIPHEIILENVSKYFGNLKAKELIITKECNNNYKPEKKELKKNFQQSHILFCNKVPGISSDVRYPLALLNIILGDGMSSRLYRHLRENHALAYTVYSSLQLMMNFGSISIYAATDKKKSFKSESLIIEDLKKISAGKIKNQEMLKAKEQFKSSTVMALESMSARMQALIKSEMVFGRNETINETINTIDKISIDELNQVAQNYFNVDNWSEIIFHPED